MTNLTMLERIQSLAKEIAPRLIEIRRHIHSHPELSGHEYQLLLFFLDESS